MTRHSKNESNVEKKLQFTVNKFFKTWIENSSVKILYYGHEIRQIKIFSHLNVDKSRLAKFLKQIFQ